MKAELFYGAARSVDPQRTLASQKRFLALFPSLAFDDAAAEAYGSIRGVLQAKGTPVGPNDLLIASIALANAITLVTHNMDEFRRIGGLLVEDWEL